MSQKKFLSLIEEVIQNKISDLHISTNNPPYIRNKTGDIVPVESFGVLSEKEAEELAKFLLGKPFEGNTHDVSFAHNDTRFRVNISRTIDGITVAFRTIPSHIPEPSDIFLPKSLLEATEANK